MGSTWKRSFVKGIIWETTGPLVLWFFTQDFAVIAGYTTVRTFLYFLNERAWKHIKWGKVPDECERCESNERR